MAGAKVGMAGAEGPNGKADTEGWRREEESQCPHGTLTRALGHASMLAEHRKHKHPD